MIKKATLKLIRLYQKTLSFDHGPMKEKFPNGYCKYRPTCSEYTYQAVSKHGAPRGIAIGLYRILRCNPFSKGGDDPIR